MSLAYGRSLTGLFPGIDTTATPNLTTMFDLIGPANTMASAGHKMAVHRATKQSPSQPQIPLPSVHDPLYPNPAPDNT